MANSNYLKSLRREQEAKKKEVVWNDTGLLPLKPKKSGGGRVVTVERLEKIYPHLCQYYELWLAYPDKLLKWYLPSDTRFGLFPYQKMALRINARYKQVFFVATRGLSKSFTSIISKIISAILLPGSKHAMLAEHKTQMARIGREKLNEIFGLMPGLSNEVNRKKGSQTTMSDDYIRQVFKGKSELDLVGITNSTRGGRRHSILGEEVKDLPGEEMNAVVLPLLNISRRTLTGVMLQNEPHQQQLYIGSAGYKNTFAYEKCIETAIMAALEPRKAFCWGMDYRIPEYYGLINPDFIDELRNSNTYSEADFAREFLSKWTSTVEGSLFEFEKLAGIRNLKKARWKPKIADNIFYIGAFDVARSKARSVFEIFEVTIGVDAFHIKLVNIILMEGRNFQYQAAKIKELHATFNFFSIIIDGNGLGVGLIDMMLLPTVGMDGTQYPPFGVQNIDEYPDYMNDTKDGAIHVMHVLKTNQHNAGLIHTNAYNMLFGGKVRLLVDEKSAKDEMINSGLYEKMTPQERLRYMEPYKHTSLLVAETSNLRIKQTGVNFSLEKIGSDLEKDTFSALEYGLWKINLLEKEQYARKKKRVSWAAAMKKN